LASSAHWDLKRDNKRQDWVLRRFRQFDAPVCMIIIYTAC
jgi:hypothetical protein